MYIAANGFSGTQFVTIRLHNEYILPVKFPWSTDKGVRLQSGRSKVRALIGA